MKNAICKRRCKMVGNWKSELRNLRMRKCRSLLHERIPFSSPSSVSVLPKIKRTIKKIERKREWSRERGTLSLFLSCENFRSTLAEIQMNSTFFACSLLHFSSILCSFIVQFSRLSSENSGMIDSLPTELVLLSCQYLSNEEVETLAWTSRRFMQIVIRNLPTALQPRIPIDMLTISPLSVFHTSLFETWKCSIRNLLISNSDFDFNLVVIKPNSYMKI